MTQTIKLSPQARWQAYQQRLPTLSRRQQWLLIIFSVLLVLAFVLLILPFLIPLDDLQDPSQFADPNGRFVTVEGRQVYLLHEPGAGDPVILIHGFNGSAITWWQTVSAFPDYDVYAVDLLGFGLSEKGYDLDLTHQAQADMLAALIDELALGAVHLVGYDMGGNVAVHLAQRHPEKLQSLTLVAAALQYDPTTAIPESLITLPFIERWAQILLRWIMPASAEVDLSSAAAQDDFIDDAIIADYQRTFQTEDWDMALLGMARDASTSYLTEPLQNLDVPTLVIWGDADRWIAPAVGEKIRTDIPGAQWSTLPDVGHLPMHEAPQAFQQALADFWDTITPAHR